ISISRGSTAVNRIPPKHVVVPGPPALFAGGTGNPFCPSILATLDYSRHPWRSPFGPPSAFAVAILQTQSWLSHHEAGASPGMTKEVAGLRGERGAIFR